MAVGSVSVGGFTKTDIQVAIKQLDPQKGVSTLYFPDGNYVCSGISIPSNVKVVFSPKAFLTPDSSTTEVLMLRGGFPASYIQLTSDGLKGDVALNLSSSAGLAAGDWIYIRSNAILSGINTVREYDSGDPPHRAGRRQYDYDQSRRAL